MRSVFFFNDPATTEIYTLSLHDALPISAVVGEGLVGLRHAEDVVLPLVRAALLGLRVEQLVGEPLGHRLLAPVARELDQPAHGDRKSTRLNSSHANISYAVFCLKKKTIN